MSPTILDRAFIQWKNRSASSIGTALLCSGLLVVGCSTAPSQKEIIKSEEDAFQASLRSAWEAPEARPLHGKTELMDTAITPSMTLNASSPTGEERQARTGRSVVPSELRGSRHCGRRDDTYRARVVLQPVRRPQARVRSEPRTARSAVPERCDEVTCVRAWVRTRYDRRTNDATRNVKCTGGRTDRGIDGNGAS